MPFPLRPGALLLKFHQAFEHGISVAYYKEIVRPRILRSPPCLTNRSGSAEVHVLTYKNDWLNLIWTLKSFYAVSDQRFPLCIHEDGSLDDATVAIIQKHFPHARIIRRSMADGEVDASLEGYPRAREFRRKYNLALKVLDSSYYLRAEKLILLDSDLIFFKRPDSLMNRIVDPNYLKCSFNADVQTAYTIDPKAVEREFGFKVLERINAGLAVMPRDVLDLDWIERFLAISDILSHFWRIEQTLFALLASRWGVEMLPEEYDVYLNPKVHLGARPSRHYVGAIRHLMYSEGMSHLASKGFLKSIETARPAE